MESNGRARNRQAAGFSKIARPAIPRVRPEEEAMASIRREVVIDASPETAWDALRDVGALHERLCPGFVTDTKLEPGGRIVSFGNGLVARELIVALDEPERRLVWSASGGRLSHHNASAQVFAEPGGRTRFVWIADLLPDEMAPAIAAMMGQGIETIRKTLERAERAPLHVST
jgi:hypothetical protein